MSPPDKWETGLDEKMSDRWVTESLKIISVVKESLKFDSVNRNFFYLCHQDPVYTDEKPLIEFSIQFETESVLGS